MELKDIIFDVANVLKEFESEKPMHKNFKAGIGPFGEPQLVKEISNRLNTLGYQSQTRRTPDMALNADWALEFKIVRPFGDNGDIAENWSVNMLHPYPGNTSLIGDAIKLKTLEGYLYKAVIFIGYEHAQPKIPLDPLISSFEIIVSQIVGIRIGLRIEQRRDNLVHPEHQVVRCVGWELLS